MNPRIHYTKPSITEKEIEYAADTGQRARSERVDQLLQRGAEAGMINAGYYTGFQTRTNQVKNDFLAFLLEAKRQGKTVAAHGAAAKGNTLMNYAGVRPDLISFVVDRNPAKQGKYMPGMDSQRMRFAPSLNT